MWFIFLVLLKYGLITDSLFIYNLSGTCPLRKVREAPFWHADLFLLMLGMCSIFYYKKHNALNLPCFLNVLCNHLKKNECCAYFGSGKNYLIEFSPYQIASRDQGGVDFCTCHLALLWVSWGSLWKGGPPWTQRASWVGLKSLKLQDMRRWVFETNPLFPKRSSVFVWLWLQPRWPDPDGHGDLCSLLGGLLWQCFSNLHMHSSHWGVVETVSWAYPLGILIHWVRVGPGNLHF